MSKNANSEKIIIETSIVFVSVASAIGLALGGIFQQYRLAYINLGKMLYYSVPFIIASLVAFISLVGEDRTARQSPLLKKVAWSFYLTGFISILLLASLAAQTEVLPEGVFFHAETGGHNHMAVHCFYRHLYWAANCTGKEQRVGSLILLDSFGRHLLDAVRNSSNF